MRTFSVQSALSEPMVILHNNWNVQESKHQPCFDLQLALVLKLCDVTRNTSLDFSENNQKYVTIHSVLKPDSVAQGQLVPVSGPQMAQSLKLSDMRRTAAKPKLLYNEAFKIQGFDIWKYGCEPKLRTESSLTTQRFRSHRLR